MDEAWSWSLGDAIAVAAAVIAICAMVVAIKQTREAKEARLASQASAAAARDQVEIAEANVAVARRSARAAESQAESVHLQIAIMLDQLAEQRADRVERTTSAQRQVVAEVLETGHLWLEATTPLITTITHHDRVPTDLRRETKLKFRQTSEAYRGALIRAQVTLADDHLRLLMTGLDNILTLWSDAEDRLYNSKRDHEGVADIEDIKAAMRMRDFNRDFLAAVKSVAERRFTSPALGEEDSAEEAPSNSDTAGAADGAAD